MVALQPGPSLAGSSSRQTGRDLARRPAVGSGQAGGSREGARGEDAVLKRGPGVGGAVSSQPLLREPQEPAHPRVRLCVRECTCAHVCAALHVCACVCVCW